MGNSYRGLRRKFGAEKFKAHNDRSKWTAKNGTRLRSLASDVVNFQDAKQELVEEVASRNNPIAAPLPPLVNNKPKAVKPSKFSALSVEELQVHKDFVVAQIKHLDYILDYVLPQASNLPIKIIARARYTQKQNKMRTLKEKLDKEFEDRKETRVALTEERILELLAEGRKVREAVEKDIAEMRRIPPEEAAQRCK